MTDTTIPEGFVDGDQVLDRLRAEPGMPAAVDNIQRGVTEMNRIYAEGLAEIRKIAEQTQSDLASRMGVNQPAVSRLESRHDILLSTLADYAAAAGAVNGRIVFQINGIDVELPLNKYLNKASSSSEEVTPDAER